MLNRSEALLINLLSRSRNNDLLTNITDKFMLLRPDCHSIYLDPIIKKVFIFDTKGLSVVWFLVTHGLKVSEINYYTQMAPP
jgi:hypothetical protein